MVRRTPILIVTSLVLLAASVAAANHLLIGPAPGLAVSAEPVVAQPSTGTTTGNLGTPGLATGPATTTNGTTNGTANGTTNGTVTPTGTLAIDQVVSITRTVPPGTPVTAFTVPAGQALVITDVLVTNPGISAVCGAAVSPAGTTTTADGTTVTSTTGEAGTGLLCVQPQTSLDLGLTTGLEFNAGQTVVLLNASTTTAGATTTTLHYHLRGFLMSTTST